MRYRRDPERIGALTCDRGLLERGQFGALSPWQCERCGPIWKEPKSVCVYRGRGWPEPEPAEYMDECPECGELECSGDRWKSNPPVKLRGRRRVTLRRAK